MVFLNGKFMPVEEARVPVLDRGFIFGDGVYELIPVYSRVPFRMDEHLARLERSLAAVRIRNPYSRAEWRDIILQLVAKQSFEDQGVYFQVTRGVAKRDHAFPKDAAPTVFVMSNPLVNPPQELVERGAAAVSAVDDRWQRCDIKSISLIGNCLLRQVSADAGAVETILFRDGMLTEASASNVFVVKGGVILSPPKSNLILPGITYDVIAEIAQAGGLPLEYRDVAEAEVRGADEVWVTSSSKEVLAIVTLDGKPVGRRQARPGVPPRLRALPGIQAKGHACRKGTASRLKNRRGAARNGFPARLSHRVPDQDHGAQGRRLHEGRDRDRAAARARFRARHHRNAPEPRGQVHQPHRHRERHLARTARCPVPGTLRSPVGRDGALMSAVLERVRVVQMGLSPYESTLQAMREFTARRDADTPDELWLLEHPPVYTLGLAADAAHGPKAGGTAAFPWCRSSAAARSPTTARARSCSTRWWTWRAAASR